MESTQYDVYLATCAHLIWILSLLLSKEDIELYGPWVWSLYFLFLLISTIFFQFLSLSVLVDVIIFKIIIIHVLFSNNLIFVTYQCINQDLSNDNSIRDSRYLVRWLSVIRIKYCVSCSEAYSLSFLRKHSCMSSFFKNRLNFLKGVLNSQQNWAESI